MARLPDTAQPSTAAAIFKSYERSANESHRLHLGASLIGKSCARAIWYTFRWADREVFDGRMLRLFASGHLQEPRLIDDLQRAGIRVDAFQPDGKQWRFTALGDHFGCSLDGAGLGFPEAPKTWHSLEFKTANQKSFDKIVKDGVEAAKPQHFAQMQVGMGLSGLTRAMYLVVNKNTDEIHSERVRFDPLAHARLLAKAEGIIQAIEPPPKLSERPDWYECKFCPFHALCHAEQTPEVNCRTCANSTPDLAATAGQWTCCHPDLASMPVLSEALQRTGCASHRYIPIFLERTAKPTDYRDGAVVYTLRDGQTFANGDGTHGTFSSAEIRAAKNKAVLPSFVQLKCDYKTAKVVA